MSRNARVLLIGLGDLGYRITAGLAASPAIAEVICAGGGRGNGAFLAGKLDSCYAARVRYEVLDATRPPEVESLLARERPDLIVICASLLNPWEILATSDPRVEKIRAAGVSVQLPSLLPVLLNVMRAVRAVDYRGSVASLPWPDGTHAVLARLGLCPTIGLGNAGMILLRAKAALRTRAIAEEKSLDDLPLVRILGDAGTLWPVLAASRPEDPDDGCRVYLGGEGVRADELAYLGSPWRSGSDLNELTTASSLPVLGALLPDAEPLRFTCPGLEGNPGGYPILIRDRQVEYDLPPGVTLTEAIAFNTRHFHDEGVERVEDDGTVIYTQKARDLLADIAPELTEPLAPDRAIERFPKLLETLGIKR